MARKMSNDAFFRTAPSATPYVLEPERVSIATPNPLAGPPNTPANPLEHRLELKDVVASANYAADRVALKSRKLKQTAVGLTQIEALNGIFGDLVGAERLYFVFTVAILSGILMYLQISSIMSLWDDSNEISSSSFELYTDVTFPKDMVITQTVCSVFSNISTFTCTASDFQQPTPANPRTNLPSICTIVSNEILGMEEVDSYCCACAWPFEYVGKKYVMIGATDFQADWLSPLSFKMGLYETAQLSEPFNATGAFMDELFEAEMRADTSNFDDSYDSMMVDTVYCPAGETTTVVPEIYSRTVYSKPSVSVVRNVDNVFETFLTPVVASQYIMGADTTTYNSVTMGATSGECKDWGLGSQLRRYGNYSSTKIMELNIVIIPDYFSNVVSMTLNYYTTTLKDTFTSMVTYFNAIALLVAFLYPTGRVEEKSFRRFNRWPFELLYAIFCGCRKKRDVEEEEEFGDEEGEEAHK